MRLLLDEGATATEEDDFGLTALDHAHEGAKKLERKDSCDMAIVMLSATDEDDV